MPFRLRILVLTFSFFVAVGCSRERAALSGLTAPEESEGVKRAPFTIRENEHLKFSIRWLGFEFGTAEVRTEKMEQIRGRDAYHISVHVRSNKLIDLVYPVRDEHHSYIDVEHFHSLRYEKILREGRYRADEVMEFDQDRHTATYYSRLNGTKKQMFIPKHVQDQLSAAYWLRVQAMKPGESVYIPVNTDERNWNLEVRVLRSVKKEITGLGTFDALEIEPRAQFQGMFVRRGKFWGWMSVDEKRLPLTMRSKIPVLGSVSITLVSYEPR
ncbi:MAG: hypothetical protein A3G87_07530 [Omnitrophica bacterium RIFCSPLOWO2_12_FULL_50_11]|nr:MAG: hypothetical protein A3G87_07530 [Omnitrophica bacterium RIFCSPLOWO2_12_FULL_50_11]